MSAWFFTYDGIEGRAERYAETVYIYWAGMGFHLEAASFNLATAIKEAEALPTNQIVDFRDVLLNQGAANSGAAMAS